MLTFMTEEARHDVLARYSKMFDEASDEQTLLQLLVSPTRQAVLIARAYNSKGGRLTSVADQDGDGTPEYAEVIGKVQEEAAARGIFKIVEKDENQVSLFDGDAGESGSAPEKMAETAETVPEAEAEKPVEPAEPEVKAPTLRFDEEGNIIFDDPDAETEDGGAEAPAAEETEPAKEEPAAPTEPDELPETPTEPEAEPIPAEAEEVKALAPEEEPEDDGLTETRRKPKVLLLIAFVLLAVPVTLALLALLLIPTFVSLALAGLLGCLGVIALTAAFGGGFAMFANILVVLGVALMLLALALLFLWIFVWFIGNVMVGLVSGVISLGRRWCYKEVQAE